MTQVLDSETIITVSLALSLVVFGVRVLTKEAKTVMGDMFQVVEFTIRWWIYIKGVYRHPVIPAVAPTE